MWKYAQHHLLLGHWQGKQLGDTNIHLLQWLKPKTQTAPNDGEGVEKKDPSFIAGGNVMGMATMKGTWAIPYKPRQFD